ncbi:MAG: hypothetical protein ACJ76H_15280 [Bacteriovoracaceae bacterium]
MKELLAFIVLSSVKIFSHIFYRREFHFLTVPPEDVWNKARIYALLNHTSLFEPLYVQGLPFRFLWKMAHHLSVPGADITLNRPLVGKFWKMMMPSISSVSRKSDNTWTKYLSSIRPDDVIFIAPEGRMKRPNGLDKFGRPMTVKPGIADVVMNVQEGGLLLCLSGGLHHIQKPGQHFPRLFKTIRMNFVYIDLAQYHQRLSGLSALEKKHEITREVQRYLDTCCPPAQIE